MKMSFMSRILLILCAIVSFRQVCNAGTEEISVGQLDGVNKFRLEGKVSVPSVAEKDWLPLAKVLVDGGQFLGILKSDGSFIVSNIPSGSYVVEVTHPAYVFDPVRVEVNSKGKTRARTLNNVQPAAVNSVSYPLRFKARGQAQYFEKREQLRITDMIFNPMCLRCLRQGSEVRIDTHNPLVMMMIVPVFFMFLLPKLMGTQDPSMQQEFQQMQSNLLQPQQNWDAAEMLTNWFGGGKTANSSGSSKKKEGKSKATKKTQ